MKVLKYQNWITKNVSSVILCMFQNESVCSDEFIPIFLFPLSRSKFKGISRISDHMFIRFIIIYSCYFFFIKNNSYPIEPVCVCYWRERVIGKSYSPLRVRFRSMILLVHPHVQPSWECRFVHLPMCNHITAF